MEITSDFFKNIDGICECKLFLSGIIFISYGIKVILQKKLTVRGDSKNQPLFSVNFF